MTPIAFVSALAGCSLALSAQTYWVDGATGVDQPGYGSAQNTPWRSIGYALAQAVAPTAGAAVVRVMGGQIYSATTNGEQYPLVLPPRISLQGDPVAPGGLPVLSPPLTDSAIVLTPSTNYPDDYTALQSLSFQGGATGITLGALPSIAHLCRIDGCEFHYTGLAGVLVVGNGGQVDANIEHSAFQGAAGVGVGVLVQNPSLTSDTWITVHGCTFRSLSAGMEASSNGWTYQIATMRLDVSASTFTDCGIGIDESSMHATTAPRCDITSCRFDSCGKGVRMIEPIFNSLPHELNVDASLFVDCDHGVYVGGNNMCVGNTADATVTNSTFHACVVGIHASSEHLGYKRLTVEDSTFLANATGISTTASSDGCVIHVWIRRVRIMGGLTGISSPIDAPGSQLHVFSTLVAGCTGSAVWFNGDPGGWSPGGTTVDLQHLTLANNATGITFQSPGISNQISWVLFQGNATDCVLPPSVNATGSVSDAALPLGLGNLSFANAQLLPGYSLAASSPCIDRGSSTWPSSALDYEGDLRMVAGSSGATPRADVGADEFQPMGSLHTYGTAGCTTTGVSPRAGSPQSSAPQGGNFDVTLTDAGSPASPVSSLAFVAIGLEDDQGPLPFDLSMLGLSHTYLWTVPADLAGPIVCDAQGSASINQVVPPLPVLASLPLHYQWLVLLPNMATVTSNALRVKLGS